VGGGEEEERKRRRKDLALSQMDTCQCLYQISYHSLQPVKNSIRNLAQNWYPLSFCIQILLYFLLLHLTDITIFLLFPYETHAQFSRPMNLLPAGLIMITRAVQPCYQ